MPMARSATKAAARGLTSVVLLQPVKTGGKRHDAGATLNLPAALAAHIVAAGAAELVAADRRPGRDEKVSPREPQGL